VINRLRLSVAAILALSLVGCSGAGLFKGKKHSGTLPGVTSPREKANSNGKTIWSLFTNADNPNVTINVNKYIWNAALDVMSFLPTEAADPFSGVIVKGWGRAKGSRRQYRATIYVQDPALDARSLRVALMTRSGPASKGTVRALEDAILTRARQLRIADGKL